MDHNAFYADLDSLNNFSSITANNNFSDTTCPTLPSLNNFKYQQSTTNIYQQQTIPDLNHTQTPLHSTKSTSTLPQTQININNCNNNIFFPHDDVLFDATIPPTATASNLPNASSGGVNGVSNSSVNNNAKNNSNNFIGYIRKDSNAGTANCSGESNTAITYNINTNIVNNINNPTNLVNSTDFFGNNQYHQINKNGETIINFTNNNLNQASSMPTEPVAATSQNFFGFQANNNNTGSNLTNTSGIVYESSVQQQQQNSSTILEPMGATKSMGNGTNGNGGMYHSHLHNVHQSSVNQSMTNGGYGIPPGNTIFNEHPTSGDSFAEYSETLSAAKIINNFESKNPLKYPTGVAPPPPPAGSRSNGYYKNSSEYPGTQYPTHHHHYMYPPNPAPPPPPPSNGISTKSHGFELYSPARLAHTRNTAMPHYQPPYGAPPLEDPHHTASRVNYARATSLHPPYHHPLPHPANPHNNYGNYYNNNYNHPMPAYSTYPQMSYGAAPMRNEMCPKGASNYSKTGAVALSPVEHGTYASYGKKDYYSENHYYPQSHHTYPPHPDDLNRTLNSCAKKSNGSLKLNGSDLYNTNSANAIYNDHHISHISHHQQNGGVMRNNYQPKSLFNANGAYAMPSSEGLSSCDYQSYNYRYKNGEMSKQMGKLPAKQFKTFNHFEPPHPPAQYVPQYHTMQVKPPEKLKLSLDLEEQINSSKIPKMRDASGYGYDLHHPYHPAHHMYYPYHRGPARNAVSAESEKIAANINISLRDFLSTWNEIDDDEEARPQNGSYMNTSSNILEDMSEHMERTIMREYNPMFVQKATDNIISSTEVQPNDKSQLLELDSGAICEGTEKLYVLETIDVPISELNKYKHLSIINKLPENVVITDKELFTDIDMNREKLYKSEFELEFEACQERKISSAKEDDVIPTVEIKSESDEEKELKLKTEKEDKPPVVIKDDGEIKKKSQVKVKKIEAKVPKIKQSILKQKKEKILKVSKDPRKTRITKRVRKYSLNQRTSSVKTLQSICVDFLNTSVYRNYAREQLSISKKFSKMQVMKDFKRKFNFDSIKKHGSSVNQKFNHSCGRASVKVAKLKDLCTRILTNMNLSVVYPFEPPTLKELCETFIYSNRQYFHIEEVSNVPKLQDLCKESLSTTNIYVDFQPTTTSSNEILTLNETIEDCDDEIFIVEESSGNAGELFESDTLNPHEKSEILRKIQRVANIDDDDEIIRAIGALHDDDDNNNTSNLYNKNVTSNEYSITREDVSYMAYTDDELFQTVQYEEIISGGNNKGEKMKKIVEILRHKYLNRCDVRQAARTLNRILRKSLAYQRVHRLRNAQRKMRINELFQQARVALLKMRKLNCDNESDNVPAADSTETEYVQRKCSSSSSSSSSSSCSSSSDDSESQLCNDPKAVQNYRDSLAAIINKRNGQAETDNNFPKLPVIFPSINEYKIERKGNHQTLNSTSVKDGKFCDMRKRKMSFDESLLNINKMYNKKSEDEKSRAPKYERQTSTSRHYSSSRGRHIDESSKSKRRRSRSRSKYRRSGERDNGSTRSSHNSSRHDHYRRDQNVHSEARRLILPRYKLYDKDLDVKLKVRPYVRIEREEKVDDMVKKYN